VVYELESYGKSCWDSNKERIAILPNTRGEDLLAGFRRTVSQIREGRIGMNKCILLQTKTGLSMLRCC
jgi:hypothetical protein